MNIYNAKNNSMPEQVLENKENIELLNTQVLENKENIELLNTGKQDTLIAGENITIDENNVISASYQSGDIVIYDNENGTTTIDDIALEIGATYEMFITSGHDPYGRQYGQQKITIKLVPRELNPNSYELFVPVIRFSLTDNNYYSINTIWIYKYDSEFWCITNYQDNPYLLIYKIIKKAV